MTAFRAQVGYSTPMNVPAPGSAALLVALAVVLPQPAAPGPPQTDARTLVAERVKTVGRTSVWTSVSARPVGFDTHHPQGMVRVGEALFVSSVEVTAPTRRFPAPVDGMDRDAGTGVGHLFKMDLQGRLLARATIGEGTMYHPGGIDYDGRWIWASVAEYRPDSRSIVYRIDPDTLQATEVFRFRDHLGAIVHDRADSELHAVSWGSRRFHRWTLGTRGEVNPDAVRTSRNPSFYVDYQDCKFLGMRQMLCSGVTELRRPADAVPFRLGGLDLVSLDDGRPLHQVPIALWTASGLAMSQNPVWIEPNQSGGLRVYFMPEDNRSTLYIYDVGH